MRFVVVFFIPLILLLSAFLSCNTISFLPEEGDYVITLENNTTTIAKITALEDGRRMLTLHPNIANVIGSWITSSHFDIRTTNVPNDNCLMGFTCYCPETGWVYIGDFSSVNTFSGTRYELHDCNIVHKLKFNAEKKI